MPNFFGIGIDILSVARSRRFLKEHGRRRTFQRLLSPAERKYWAKRPFSAAALAHLVTAKEAFFKASQGVWLGPEGFSSIEVLGFPRGRFRVKSLLSGSASIYSQAEGRYFGDGRFVGAQVIIYSPSWPKRPA